MSYIIRLRDVVKIYESGKIKTYALRGINLCVSDGEFVVITGPSGSGKSTLLNIIGGVDRPTKGEVIVDGVNLNMLSDSDLTIFRRKRIGFVFQFF